MAKINNCDQALCKVKMDGKCLESLELSECPHFYFDEETDIDEAENTPNTTVLKSKSIPLFNGAELNMVNTTLVTYQYPCENIIILGDSDSGKTTFLATIFDILQKGPLEGIYFAGSYTQVGFESRCHLSRISSEAAHADTEKTNSKELNFLHLALKVKPALQRPAVHFLISDISGERLQNARDSSSAMKELTPLKFADRIVVMLDGNKIANKRTREASLFDSYTLLKRMSDEKIIRADCDLKIVLSKWDLLDKDTSFNFEKDIEAYFLQKFSDVFTSFSFARIAARPKTPHSTIKVAFGIGELLNEWLEDKPDQSDILNEVPEKRINERWFLNFHS